MPTLVFSVLAIAICFVLSSAIQLAAHPFFTEHLPPGFIGLEGDAINVSKLFSTLKLGVTVTNQVPILLEERLPEMAI